VTGAAGRLGRVVIRELARRGIAATGLARAEDLAKLVAKAEHQAGPEAEHQAEHQAGPETEDADELARSARMVTGDAGDPDAVGGALDGVDAVIHLAAIATPTRDPGRKVFCDNTMATFTVLDEAARVGISRAAIASSWSVTGLPFAPALLAPAYVPIDEDLPLQVADPYALSKQVDEATGEMMWRRHGMSVIALRLPFLGRSGSDLPARAAQLTDDPAAGVRDMWSYLDYRDAARACVDAVTVDHTGFAVVGMAAPETLCPYPTEALLDRYLPDVPRRAALPGRTVPIDVTRAQRVLGFSAIHLWPVETSAL
jgi:nucleoside-diphosphate-sugar epimerase